MWNCTQLNAIDPLWYYVNIGSGDNLVLSGNKPLPESTLIQTYHVVNRNWLTTIRQAITWGNIDWDPF